jgi:hypothetical protein
MIGNLMRKDLVLYRSMVPWIALSIALNLVLLAVEGDRAAFPLGFGAFIAGFLPVMISGGEERFRTNSFTCALPVRRSAIVLSRYLLPIALFPGWMAFCAGLVWALGGFRLPAGMPRFDTLASAFAVQALTVSVTTPLILSLGFIGLVIGLVAFQVLALGVLVVGPRFGLRHGILAIEDAVRSVGPGLRALRASLGDPVFYLAGFAALAALLALSYTVSCALFQRRNL